MSDFCPAPDTVRCVNPSLCEKRGCVSLIPALDTPAKTAPPAAGTRAGVLLRGAADIVDGARNVTHGDKERSFRAIAAVWDAHLASRPGGREQVMAPSDVAAMMVLLKLKRSEHGQHIEDHGIDAVGYAAIWGEMRETEA